MQTLTVELPDAIFRLLAHLAELTRQSPEQLAAQSIAGNLPPSVENAPPEIDRKSVV
jgi:predicted transcriptional regulator